MLESVKWMIESVNNFLWGKNILVFLLVGSAIYFSIRTRFMQFRLFKTILKTLFHKEENQKGISSLETFFLGTACRVGAGNIAGVVAAISVGGPGSIFWMWLVALLGASTSFIESCLAVMYREKLEDGKYIGGSPWILKKQMNCKWLGVIYAIASIICYLGVVQVMSNSITESVTSVYSHVDFGLTPIFQPLAAVFGVELDQENFLKYFLAVLISIITASVIFGKSKKDAIIEALNRIVPIMAVLYILLVIFILLTNITAIPAMIQNIFYQAFGGEQFLGAGFGIVVMQGVRRGLFSNEAGSGDSNYAAAVVDIEEPARQGMVQALGVFVDTLVICSATAFIVLLADPKIVGNASGMELFQLAIQSHIGKIGAPFVVIIMFFFAFSTILAVTFYGKSAIYFIHSHSKMNVLYQVFIIVMVYVGGIKQNLFVWSLADFGLGIMTVINIIMIVPFAKPALEELKQYEKILKRKKMKECKI